MTTGETQGFMKVLIAAGDDSILGFTMLGADAGEVMAVVQTAIGRLALPEAARGSPRPPDNGRRVGFPVLERAPLSAPAR